MGRYLEKAKAVRENPMYNCCQAMLLAFTDQLGIDEQTAIKLGANFGGGMKCGSTCGAVSGCLMIMGLLGIDSPAAVQDFIKEFKNSHGGMINCSELLKANALSGGTKKVHCDNLVFFAAEYLEKILK